VRNLRIYFCFFLFFISFTVYADHGAVFSQGFLFEKNDESDFISKTALFPWLSLPLGNVDFYLSAGVSANYEDKMVLVPELHRLQLSFKSSAMLPLDFRLGRIFWQDPSGFTAQGYFDGLDVFHDLGSIRLGAALFYTGLLYKDTARINMSPKDPVNYSKVFDWGDFGNTYFAPRRLLTCLYGDFPGFLPPGRGNIYAGFLAQFDLSDAEEAFHSQYFLLRYAIDYKRFDLSAAGAMEFENTETRGFKAAFAYTLEGGMQTGFISDRLSLGLRWASGEGENTAAFFPLIRQSQGMALRPIFSGIMTVRANYQARILPTLAGYFGGRYLIRTDSKSFYDY